MPRAHHGGSPLTKRQQHKKTARDTKVAALAAGTDRPSIDAEPFDHGRWERAVTTHIAGRTPAPTAGGTLSISDGAQQLSQISQDQSAEAAIDSAGSKLAEAVAALQQAKELIEQHGGQAAAAAGGAEGDTLNGLAQAGGQAIDNAISVVAMFDPEAAQQAAMAFYSAVGDSARQHGAGS